MKLKSVFFKKLPLSIFIIAITLQLLPINPINIVGDKNSNSCFALIPDPIFKKSKEKKIRYKNSKF